jgi:hypothetical protein
MRKNHMSPKRGILERTVDRLGEVDTGQPESEFKVKGRDKLHDVIRVGMAWNWGRAKQKTVCNVRCLGTTIGHGACL